jgi:lysozyme
MNKVSKSTYNLLLACEGEKLEAYKCTAGTWTIGIGITIYPEGTRVKKGDKITKERSLELFFACAKQRELDLNKLVKLPVTQNQWDVCFSILWQYGIGWFLRSKFLKQMCIDPNNTVAIKNIFGLMEYDNRRSIEFKHYEL